MTTETTQARPPEYGAATGSAMFRRMRHGHLRVGSRVYYCPKMAGRRDRVVLVCPSGEVRTRGGFKHLGWLRELHAKRNQDHQRDQVDVPRLRDGRA